MPLIVGPVIIGENLAMPTQAPAAQRGTGITERGTYSRLYYRIPTRLDMGNNRTNKY